MKPIQANLLVRLAIAGLAIAFVSIHSGAAADLKNPDALVFDSSGNLFVADNGAETIFKFAQDGAGRAFATGVHLADGAALAVDNAGNLFALNPSGQYHIGGTILKFSSDGTRSTAASDVGLPYSLAIDQSGNLFVSDWDTGSIFKFTPDGKKSTVAKVGEVGVMLTIDRTGNLFVADAVNSTILKFQPGSSNAATFATGIRALALAVDQANNLFAEDSENTIIKFSPTGAKSLFAKLTTPLKSIAFDADGNLFGADRASGTIYKFAADGTKTVFVSGRAEPAVAEKQTETEEDSAERLPASYAKHYLVAQNTRSPDKKFAVIYPTTDDSEFPGGKNYLVSLKPFSILAKLETKRPYFKNESHGGLSAEWSNDGSVVMITLDSKWGPGDVFVIEVKNGKVARATNILAKAHDLLVPEFRKANAGRYNDFYDFIFESENAPGFQLNGSKAVNIDAATTTDPKGAESGRVWDGHIKAVWDIPQGKFTSQKVTTEFAGVRKHGE